MPIVPRREQGERGELGAPSGELGAPFRGLGAKGAGVLFVARRLREQSPPRGGTNYTVGFKAIAPLRGFNGFLGFRAKDSIYTAFEQASGLQSLLQPGNGRASHTQAQNRKISLC